MSAAQRYAIGWLLAIVAAAYSLPNQSTSLIEGAVSDERHPVANASVGWQGRCERVVTDALGRYRLPRAFQSSRIIASKTGYRIASAPVDSPFSLRLERLPVDDNEDYAWIDPHADSARPNNCANCHGAIYREWQQSAHARSATNPKFLSLYAGTDGAAPMQKTWNARAEYPGGAAVCATCHVPTLRSPTLDYDIREATGVAKSGIHCDYCHKIAETPTDKFGTRFGRDGLHLLRPANGDLLSFGPLDDAVRKGESFGYSPLYKESRYCASCHEGTVFGVHAYGTYSEWLESPAKQQGKQCQDCHMTPTGKMTNIAPGKGGIERDPKTLASHHTPGGLLHMLRQSLKLNVRASAGPGGRQVEVAITAQRVGHRVPTGFVDRQLILLVEAFDEKGHRVELLDGPRLPASAGKWKDWPGALYAKQLFGDNGRSPVPFWMHVTKTEDTRLFPEQPDRRTFLFSPAARHVTVQFWYRRFWHEVAHSRRWADNDMLVIEQPLSFDGH
jgi:hypothetical protein